MYISKFYGIFFALMIAFFAPLFISSLLNAQIQELDIEIQQKMDAAAYGAAGSVHLEDGKAFASETQRTEALDAFYNSLAAAYHVMNETISANRAAAYVPCVILADMDGAYTCYGKAISSPDDAGYFVTPITTYSADYRGSGSGDYGVSFYMDGTASVRKDGALIANGDYAALRDALSEEDIEALPFLKNESANEDAPIEESFEEERLAVITNTITRIMETYVNQEGYNPKHIHYTVPAPEGLEGPAVLAAFTGSQVWIGNTLKATCLLSGATVGREPVVFVSEEGGALMYHTEDCSLLTDEDKQSSYTMIQAAKAGALPCPRCIY